MIIQGVGFLFSSLDKALTTDAEHDRKERALAQEAEEEVEAAAAAAPAAKAPATTVTNDTNASQPALGSA